MSTQSPQSLVVLISGSGSNLQAIIDAVKAEQINASLSAVISNRPDAYGLERAHQAGIKTIVVDHTEFNTREDFDRALSCVVAEQHPDLIILAGFMRILSNDFIAQYEGRILNIHPSLLPLYKGLHTHRKVLEAGDKVHGASVHFVNAELDSGPVVIQAEIQVNENDTESSLAQRIHQQEHIIYPLAIQWYVDGRLQLHNHQLSFDQEPLKQPVKWISNTLQFPEQTA